METPKKAVALLYDFKSDAAPRVIARGLNKEAELIEEIALDNFIPVKQDEGLADTLFQLPLLEEIPDSLYVLVAAVYIELNRIEKK